MRTYVTIIISKKIQIINTLTKHQLFFLTIAKKNNTNIPSVMEAVTIDINSVSRRNSKFSSKDSTNNWIPNSANAAAANNILLSPVFLYADRDIPNNNSEKIPVIARIIVSIPSYESIWSKGITLIIKNGITISRPRSDTMNILWFIYSTRQR
jgi:hypothetical protein